MQKIQQQRSSREDFFIYFQHHLMVVHHLWNVNSFPTLCQGIGLISQLHKCWCQMSTGFRWQVLSWGSWVKSIQFPKEGIFSVRFCFLEFHLKGKTLSLKTAEFGCNHSHPTGGDSLMATQGNVQFNCLANPTSLSKIWEKYTHFSQIKILYQTEQKVKQFERFTSPPK